MDRHWPIFSPAYNNCSLASSASKYLLRQFQDRPRGNVSFAQATTRQPKWRVSPVSSAVNRSRNLLPSSFVTNVRFEDVSSVATTDNNGADYLMASSLPDFHTVILAVLSPRRPLLFRAP